VRRGAQPPPHPGGHIGHRPARSLAGHGSRQTSRRERWTCSLGRRAWRAGGQSGRRPQRRQAPWCPPRPPRPPSPPHRPRPLLRQERPASMTRPRCGRRRCRRRARRSEPPLAGPTPERQGQRPVPRPRHQRRDPRALPGRRAARVARTARQSNRPRPPLVPRACLGHRRTSHPPRPARRHPPRRPAPTWPLSRWPPR